ncbi:serine hydrolase domain-containing protein [Candidatus Neomarinimicrobiota bacterium]
MHIRTINKVIFPITIFIIIIYNCSENPVNSSDGLFQSISPAEAGFSSTKLEEVKDFAQSHNYTGIVAVYDGDVFFSWGNVTYNYKCHSIRKPLLGSLYGIQIDNGNIDISNTLEDLGIDDSPNALTEPEKQATIRDLLKSMSGVYIEAAYETQGAKDTRPERGSHDPGTYFYYNNWDFNTLGTIFEEETGTAIFEEFKNQIAGPIGMEDFNVNNCEYIYELDLSQHPAYTFRMSTRDMARFGVLHQQDGNWDGDQIISNNWISESTTTYAIGDSTLGLGYGYLWATIPEGSPASQIIGTTGYYHSGAGGHLLLVLPSMKLVIVERINTDGNYVVDPGDAMMQIAKMIIDAKMVS